MKNPRKYVELLEVNNKTKATHTKATVSNLNAKHLSKLVSYTDVSLGQLHKLKSSKKKMQDSDLIDYKVDVDLLREVENSVLQKYRQNESCDLQEDDCAIIFASERLPNLQYLNNPDNIKKIKDSFDKFRRETVRDQKMKDLIFAINEGVNQNMDFSDLSNDDYYPDIQSHKGPHQLFRDYLLEMKQSKYDIYDTENLDDVDLKGIHLSPDFVKNETDFDLNEVLKKSSKSHSVHEKDSSQKSKKSKTSEGKMPRLSGKSKKKKAAELIAAQHWQEIQKIAKEHSLNKLLMVHLDICVATGSIDKGLQILNYYRNKGKKHANHPQLVNVKLYNIILQGYATQGDYKNVAAVLDIMKNDSIDINVQSYAAVFESIERSKILEKNALLKEYYGDLLSKGFSLNDMFEQSKFTKDQKEHVLNAVGKIDPSFIPLYRKPCLNYDCKLVNHLNPNEYNNSHNAYISPAEGLITSKELMDKALKQMKNEICGIVKIENIENKGEPTESVLFYRKKFEEWENEWRETIKKSFLRNLATLKSQSNASNNPINIHPYLTVLPINEFVDLLMYEIRKLADGSETYSPSLRSLQRDLGYKVNLRYQIDMKNKNGVIAKITDLYKKYCQWYMDRNREGETEKFNSRKKWQEILYHNQNGASMDLEECLWPSSICVGVGKFLYNILVNDIHVDVNVFKRSSKKKKHLPAFYNVYRGQGYRIRHEVKPHPVLVRLLRESCSPMLHMEATLVPSLCPPLPWTSPSHGGYLLTKNSVMRLPHGAVQQMHRLETCEPHVLLPSLDSLNQLGAVPWRVNRPILDVLIKIFKTGGSRELNVACPSYAAPSPPPLLASLSRKDRMKAQQARTLLARRRQEMHSLWCDSLYKLSLANHFRDEVFWLPHNMDFRGRVYPCPPHLSHLSSDNFRALMIFARGLPLGAKGLDWLKLHCINLTGFLKSATVPERLEYAEKVMDDIFDSADHPVDGRQWWAKSDKPWQTLACSMEIANASRSPNPEEYISHYPIHQDGSCNGLQHYAALGGDSAGAFSVNLSKADRPQDVYSAVVSLVEASRALDAANGVKDAQVLEGFVKRKVIKQTIMTTVYGVTKYGARLQIAKQLKDIDNFPKDYVWSASIYLTIKTFESLREMFTSTKEIQDWLTECAKLIASVRCDKVEWVTPLGLPIIQPYHKQSKQQYRDNSILEFASYDQFEKPCMIKQKNAFPPNFIHSLDSTHMMLTSLHCETANVTFVSVHDCFWTHPATVDAMNKICREQFVALHSQPILEDLSEYLVKKYSFNPEELTSQGSVIDTSKRRLTNILSQLPQKGDFDLQNVLESVYFFS